MIVLIVVPLVLVACVLLGLYVAAALHWYRRCVGEQPRVHRVVQSADWRLAQLGQQALAEMLDTARRATEGRSPGAGS